MQDPFRPNSNAQLIREAQIGFVVIGLLLCVLVYVAFYRLTGRGKRYEAISRQSPVARSIGADPYQARTIIQNKFDQQTRGGGERLFEALNSLSLTNVPTQPKKAARASLALESVPPAAHVDDRVALANLEPGRHEGEERQVTRAFEPVLNDTGVAEARQFPVETNVAQSDNHQREIPEALDFKPDANDATAGDAELPPVIKSEFGRVEPNANEQSANPIEVIGLASKNTFGPLKAKPTKTVTERLQQILAVPKLPERASTKIVSAENSRVEIYNEAKSNGAIEPLSSKKPDALPEVVAASFEIENASEPSSEKIHRVSAGESLWTIAQQHYGDGAWFRAAYEYNRQRIGDSEDLPVGVELEMPDANVLRKQFPTLCPAKLSVGNEGALDAQMQERYHLTQGGETLFEIARQRLGQASRYLEIHELNQFRIPKNVGHLTPLAGGLRLLLPE